MTFSYIGITDFATPEQSLRMARHFEDTRVVLGDAADRRLMVGVMMSYKTLHGIETKWAAAWPAKEEVADIFVDHPLVFNTLHYADFDGTTTLDDLLRAVAFGGPNLHALQFDMIWPNPDLVWGLYAARPELSLILQVSGRALEKVGNDPHELAMRLNDYGNALGGVLLDKSMGRGLGMDARGLQLFLAGLLEYHHHLRLAVAGGLGPGTLHLVESLVEWLPWLSIDAQGKLRPSGSALDPIDWGFAGRYLREALEMYVRYQ